jgi:hypothetical protein
MRAKTVGGGRVNRSRQGRLKIQLRFRVELILAKAFVKPHQSQEQTQEDDAQGDEQMFDVAPPFPPVLLRK